MVRGHFFLFAFVDTCTLLGIGLKYLNLFIISGKLKLQTFKEKQNKNNNNKKHTKKNQQKHTKKLHQKNTYTK